MKYINTLQDGDQVKEIYLCRKSNRARTKAGKAYVNLTLCDRSGSVDAKIWEPDSPGIGEYDELDYIWVMGDVTVFNGKNQVNIRQLRRAAEDEYDPADYVASSSRPVDTMMKSLLSYIDSIEAPYMKALLSRFFIEDKAFAAAFSRHSAAKSVHHGYIGGLLEHTLSVTGICDYFAQSYHFLDRDLLLTAAICHDIGKVRELSPFPRNDYTDEGQLLGHIMIGAQMINDAIREINDFPPTRANELLHCILSHHGELEFGSPKKPAIPEAVALSFADNTDAKLETMREALAENPGSEPLKWYGFNRYLDSNIRRTSSGIGSIEYDNFSGGR